MEWDFAPVWSNFDLLMLGLLNSLKVFALAIVLGVPIGLGLALMRLSPFRALSWPATALIEVLRATPPIVLLFWVFFAAPILLNLRIGPFEASVVTLAVASSAFFAEVFRGGIVSVERGLIEASKALAMSPFDRLRRIVLPIAVKRMMPAFFERGVELLKATTLVSTVSYADMMFQANALVQQTYRPLEIYTVVALIYFVVIYAFSLVAGRVERWQARTGDAGGH